MIKWTILQLQLKHSLETNQIKYIITIIVHRNSFYCDIYDNKLWFSYYLVSTQI